MGASVRCDVGESGWASEYWFEEVQINYQKRAPMSTSYRGTTWGKIEIEETALRLKTLDETPKSILGIEFQSINNATVNKNDIIIESGAEIENDEDCMCEIRFHVEVPKEENDMEDEVENSNAQKEDEEGDEDRKQKVSLAQNIYNTILERAKIGSFGGESLVTLNEVNLAVPRGKYTIDFYQKNLRFHGQTYNFLIEYKNIMKGFLLPMENESQVSMILQLHKDRPVYQGQTVYRYIVIQVKKDVDVDIKTRIKDKDKQKYPNLVQLKEEYTGPLFQAFMDIIRSTAQITLIAPDSRDYKSRTGQSCVKCGVKAQAGWLYFLKKSMIFIPKPVIYFKTEEMRKVEFSRLGATNKQFDMKVTLMEEKKAVEFMGIERNELEGLIEYFKARNVKVEMEEEVKKIQTEIVGEDDEDEEEDGDFNADEVDSEDDEDESFEDEELSAANDKKGKKESDKKEEKGEKAEGAQ